jgi:hypothetical protein
MANSVNIPQANSVETLVHVVDAIDDGLDHVAELVDEFEVRERTIHYYLELAEWLGFLKDRKATQLHLTDEGQTFARNWEERGRLYNDGVMQHELVQAALAEADDHGYDTLRRAFTSVITDMGVLAEATAKRRAGALATLVQAAVDDDAVEWETGRMGQPTRMKRKYQVGQKPQVDDGAETATWERPRDPKALVGEEEFDSLDQQITAVLGDIGPATSGSIRDELAERFDFPLTDPSVFVVLREGLSQGKWLADHNGHYRLISG